MDVYEYARSFLGVPYKYGGKCRIEGLDCSGFVCEVLRSVGLIKNHGEDLNAQELYEKFKETPPPKSLMSTEIFTLTYPILYFYGKSLTQIDHVALGFGTGLIIEAGGGDATTLLPQDANHKNACVRVRTIKYREDFLDSKILFP